MGKYKLKIDFAKQKIAGVKIKDPIEFSNIKSAVEAAYLEGWKPKAKDIKDIMKAYNNPEINERIKDIINGNK